MKEMTRNINKIQNNYTLESNVSSACRSFLEFIGVLLYEDGDENFKLSSGIYGVQG